MTTPNFKIKDIHEEVKNAREYALREAKRNCGRGCYQSRGAWIVVIDNEHAEPVISNGEWEFKPTRSTHQKILDQLSAGREVYVEGGFNYGESVRDFADGVYEPYVSEWSIQIS